MISRIAFARMTAASAFFLLIAGGLVTSTGSGLSVPDWPLSFGTILPPMVGGVFFEHGHRLIAGIVALSTFGLTFWIWKEEPRGWLRWTAGATALAILLQALLGGLTVLLKLPPQVSIAHACLGQAVFCLLLVLADGSGSAPEGKAPAGLWKLAAAAAAAVFLQLVLGALIRHAGSGIGKHLLWALIVVSLLTLLSTRVIGYSSPAFLRLPAWLLAGLFPLQLGLGLASYLSRRSLLSLDYRQAAAVTTAHLGLGALLLGACVILALRAYRLR